MSILWAYLGHLFGISLAYLGHISGLSLAYVGHFSDQFGQLFFGYLGHIGGISWAYLDDWLPVVKIVVKIVVIASSVSIFGIFSKLWLLVKHNFFCYYFFLYFKL